MSNKKKIGLREVRSLKAGETMWDSVVAGFGIRRQNSLAVAYVLLYRTKEGRLRRYTIGRHGAPWTPETARDEATRVLGKAKAGDDPAATKKATLKAPTVAALCESYMKDAEAGRLLTRQKKPKKMSTLAIDKGRIARHIIPILGHLKVAAVTSRDVENFMNAVAEGKTAGNTKTAKKRGLAIVRGGKGTASRAVGFLGGLFTYAIRQHMRTDNPVRGVIKFADGKRERRMSEGEYKILGKILLGKALAVAEPEPEAKPESKKAWPPAVAVIKFLALTGWRRGEAINLRWKEVDTVQRVAILPDTKTGRSVRPLSHAACDVLSGMTRRGDDDLVFQATRGDGPMVGFPKLWAKIVKKGTLPSDITPHVLRHSFISLAADLGYSEPTIASLVGHKGQSITSRYIHSADAVLLAAADVVANKTAELMGMVAHTAEVVPLRRKKAE